MLYVPLHSLAGVVLGLKDSHSSEGFRIFCSSSRSVLSPKTQKPQAQALWVVAFALEPGNSSSGPCLDCEPLAAITISLNNGFDFLDPPAKSFDACRSPC